MDPVQLTGLLSSGGPYAIVAVLCGVIAKLWADGVAKDRAHIETLTAWREDTASSNEKLYGALETLKAVMAQSGRLK